MPLRLRNRWVRFFVAFVMTSPALCDVRIAPTEPVTIDLATDEQSLQLTGDAGKRTGLTVAHCDVNADGLTDVAIGEDGAFGPSGQRYQAGAVYLLLGSRRAWSGTEEIAELADTVFHGEELGDYLGRWIACGDVDDDGYDDLLIGANGGDGPYNSRQGAGQLHIILGRPDFEAEIDLAETPGIIVYGEISYGKLGLGHSTGDVNGDGIDDILLGTSEADSFSGRAYILFGRPSWPETIDLARDADVRFFGTRSNDRLGDYTVIGDLDLDGIKDVIIDAERGDGPNDTRKDAGDIHVFFGRAVWPSYFNLATDQADQLIYGADTGDKIGRGQGLVVNDFDDDGTPELWIEVSIGDGPANDLLNAGEVRLFEYAASRPKEVDLEIWTDRIIYGSDLGDGFGVSVWSGRVSVDGVSDLITGSRNADGPDEDRSRSGEVYVFFGGTNVAETYDLSVNDPDVLVYGAAAGEFLTPRSAADINGDGFDEVFAAYSVDHSYRVPGVWVVSPLDTDGDGLRQIHDNCPLVTNPSQADADGDRRGDACADDWDGDGQIDAEDCAVDIAAGGTPGEVSGLRYPRLSKSKIRWNDLPFANLYDVLRGDIDTLSSGSYGSCLNDEDPNRMNTEFEDPTEPSPGKGFFYLVRGYNVVCAQGGTYGTATDGSPREPDEASNCP